MLLVLLPCKEDDLMFCLPILNEGFETQCFYINEHKNCRFFNYRAENKKIISNYINKALISLNYNIL